MEIIGAGLPRTGTMSLKKALEQLGTGKCYHMIENFKNKHSKIWADIYEGKHQNWEKVFKNFTSTVDAPACFFWQELLKENPNAKIILTVRDKPEAWYKSVSATIYEVIYKPTFAYKLFCVAVPHFRDFYKLMELLKKRIGNSTQFDHTVKFYEDYVNNVIENCPKERLLVYNVKDGWKPLCKFLKVKEPDFPFPNVNSSDEFVGRFRRMKLVTYFLLTIVIWLIITMLYFLIKKFMFFSY